MRVRKGDRVQVRSGKHRGQRAAVVRALPAEGRVVLEGVNVAKRHTKPTRATMQGGIIDKFMPVPVSAVSVVCPACGQPTRIGIRVEADGERVRICRKCGGDL